MTKGGEKGMSNDVIGIKIKQKGKRGIEKRKNEGEEEAHCGN